MNRDEGQYQLSHIYDELLVTPGSKSPGEKQSGNSTISSSSIVSSCRQSLTSVEKDSSLHRNVHKIVSGIFWIRTEESSFDEISFKSRLNFSIRVSPKGTSK